MNKQHSIQYQSQRKFLLVLPLILLPFLSLAFYALGGGKGSITDRQANITQGLNTQLPGAAFDKHEKPKDKLSFYDQAKQDSVKQQSGNNNPILQQFGFKSNLSNTAATPTSTPNSPLTTTYTDPNVVKINQKLADINKQISQPQAPPVVPVQTTGNKPEPDKAFSDQVNKLETMMKSVNSGQGNDPEMQQLSKMLAQIQAIQHPELTKADNKPTATESPFKAISATIEGNQKVLQGGAVKLRLNDSLTIKGQLIPKGTMVFGTANITNQRLLLDIKNIRLGEAIIPVDLTVYDMDSMAGIPAPEAEMAGAAGSGADNAMQSMQFLSMDQSLATQAAAGGISAAKGLFSKKVKRIKIHLKNGYPVLLRNNKLN